MTTETIATKHEDIDRATYSPEDNKLRIYPLNRLDKDLYDELKAQGFGWAPRQELFVKPSWSPAAEDMCLKLAGTIEPEDTTMVERAEVKAERLRALAEKRAGEARGFNAAANNMSYGNQPILAGHHSQRKMEKTQRQQERNEERADEATRAVRYWNWKMMGSISHANHKNRWDVIDRRIKTLLKDLRTHQRKLHAAGDGLSLWERCQGVKDVEKRKAFAIKIANYRWDICTSNCYRELKEDEKPLDEIITANIELSRKRKENPELHRYIAHTLNRLTYERAQLGDVSRYDGKLIATILQTFLRTHGADKPKAVKSDYGWVAECLNDLPVHIGEGSTLELTEDDWRDLMVECGYEVPAPKPKAAPLLNLDSGEVKSVKVRMAGTIKELRVIATTKAEYMQGWAEKRACTVSECGQFRVKLFLDPHCTKEYYMRDWVVAHLTDSKEHKIPESDSIIMHGEVTEADNA